MFNDLNVIYPIYFNFAISFLTKMYFFGKLMGFKKFLNILFV